MSTVTPSTIGPEGMPASYALCHGREEQEAHGQIVARRKGSLVQVEACPGKTENSDTRWMCVVTDDRPGLLSLLTAAISAHSLDIQKARIYCRARVGHPDEAIDLFAVRDALGGGPLTEEKVAGVRATIESLLVGRMSVATLEKKASPAIPARPKPITVRFDGLSDLLIVEAHDRPGLLLAISLAIFRERLTIVRSHVTTLSEHARDEFELAQIDGRRLTPSMRDVVVQKVRASLEGAAAAEMTSVTR